MTAPCPERSSESRSRFRIGTRGSDLALAQTDFVIRRLAASMPGVTWVPQVIRTEGDVDKTSPLTVIGGQGVFTSALQEALARGEIDAAVHSAKDLPSWEPDGLALLAFPVREDPRDVLVSRHGLGLTDLPASPTVGTSSRRRAVQVRLVRPDARIVELRGNIDTRLRKALDPASDLDAIVIASAGVQRLGRGDFITEALPLDRFVPSPGQGALAVEGRAGDHFLVGCLTTIDDPHVSGAVRIERAFLRAIGAGCTTPVGAYATEDASGWRLRAMLASDDGAWVEWADERLNHPVEEAAGELAVRVLAKLRSALDATSRDRFEQVVRSPYAGSNLQGAADDLTLLGRSVLVTRAVDQAETLLEALRRAGAEAVALPTIEISSPADPGPLTIAVEEMVTGRYHWVVFTSANAVDHLIRAGGAMFGREALGGARVAAVGAATAARLLSAGITADVVPASANADALVDVLLPRCGRDCRLLYPHGDLARETMVTRLERAGANVDAVPAYRTLPVSTADPAVLQRLRDGEIDVVTFASPSSARNLMRLTGGPGGITGARVVCVGAVTAAAARELGLSVDAIAADATVEGLLSAVVEAARFGVQRKSGPERSARGRDVRTGGVPAGVGVKEESRHDG